MAATKNGCFVADSELVVPGGHRSVPLEAFDASFDCAALAVVGLVEPRRAATVSAEYALSARTLRGRVRGRLTRGRGTRMRLSTASNRGESPRSPGRNGRATGVSSQAVRRRQRAVGAASNATSAQMVLP